MEKAGIYISDLLEIVGELMINRKPVKKEMADDGGELLDLLNEADKKLKMSLSFINLLKDF